jgi:hypothetical protein
MPGVTTQRRRRRSPRRLLALLLVAAAMASVLPASASAASIRRTWTANFGSPGTARLIANWSGTGSFAVALGSLPPTTTLAAIVYRGTCASPILIARLPGVGTDASGLVSSTTAVGTTAMNAIWAYGRTGSIALRIAGGGVVRCAGLTYPVASRIAIPALTIDLPVVRAPNAYPLCNVGMYIKELSQPREWGVTLIYAHARVGMFLPLLTASKVNDGASLIGMTVRVWTSDSVLSTYRIIKVRRHVTTLDGVFGVNAEQLWIQTSEGVRGTTQKLILVATRVSSVASPYADAHPKPSPVVCQ